MDRVLLIMDDIQYNRQVETTLRKVGFEVESVNNEFNVNEPLLAFNPDYIIVRGNSARLSVLNVGKKLKESNHINGKIILVFPEHTDLASDELFKIKADIILTDPISTLRLVLYLISISGQDVEFVKEKIMKYAVTDSQFRLVEQQILKNAGITVDSEIETLSNMERMPQVALSAAYVPKDIGVKREDQSQLIIIKDDKEANNPLIHVLKDDKEKQPLVKVFKDDKNLENKLPQNHAEVGAQITEEIQLKLAAEIRAAQGELPLRIDSYNRAIKAVDQDLKHGLNKRQTKREFNRLHKDLMEQNKTDKMTEADLDDERIRFTQALFKKK